VKITGLELTFFYTSLRIPYSGKLPGVKTVKIPPTLAEILFNRVHKVPIEKFIGTVDVFHSSDWLQPPTKAKKVTTFHDVIPLMYPDWSEPKIVSVHKKRLAIVEKEIDRVIAVSNTTKKDLMAVSRIPEEKIIVIYEGIDTRFKIYSEDEVANFRLSRQLPEKFLLAIGGRGNRRNLERVKEAAGSVPLIITGVNLERVSDEEMPLLYNAAMMLVYPSLYEGFGLPIMEAFACGTPVITSNVGAMVEVADGAALLVDPNKTAQISKAVLSLMEDSQLRQALINKGIIQASRFSWEKAAAATVEVYKSLLT
jgi:glycosyltransferase involved in cell wall biosynthesis